VRSAPTASGHVIQESKGWGKIALGIVALIFFGPMLVATFAGALTDAAIPNAGDAADKLTCWPVQPACPPERLRQSSTAPTTVAPPQMTQSELEARMQAKSLGDGLAAARAATPAPQVDPRGGLPSIDGGGTGGIVGELPAVGGIVRALTQGGGLKALNP
jgi:hypothetical protein